MSALPSDVTWVQRARAGWLYAVGLIVDGVGFLASIVALQQLPLFLVQAFVASAVAVTAALAVPALGIKLSRKEIAAIGAIAFGLILLAISAAEGEARRVSSNFEWTLLGCGIALGLLLTIGLLDRSANRSCIVLATTSGLGFGVVALAARVLEVRDPWWSTLASPALWAIVAAGAVALVAYGFALDRGRATTVAAITSAVETIIPAGVGLIVLGDEFRSGFAPVAVVGFVVTLGACFVLAARAEVE
ncbi:hypothetical protein ATK17_0575 [Branchiibius hedensis]|uniref:EamA-like transporter family protein n=1 Tax=Branchiibius hedensis TaxID=672460 RepID=A0A2Y8ZLI8_9MICO|nr:hypothetical protein [Branchiibius hedensis]PWJ24484.1 hypothetical protein ATK17_0575 [Branchiibius hedensis]SSA33301.1 hypothetical protein SAMN04489750_0575 [Branchiibius hedensis]